MKAAFKLALFTVVSMGAGTAAAAEKDIKT